VLNPVHSWPNKSSYEARLTKYATRGFAVAVPGADLGLIDYERITRTPFDDLRGFARLLRISNTLAELTPCVTNTESIMCGLKKIMCNTRFSMAGEYFIDLPAADAFGTPPVIEPHIASVRFTDHINIQPRDPHLLKICFPPPHLQLSQLSTWLETATAVQAAQMARDYPNEVGWTVAMSSDYLDPDGLGMVSDETSVSFWDGIFDVGHDHLRIPRRLNDAWDVHSVTPLRARFCVPSADASFLGRESSTGFSRNPPPYPHQCARILVHPYQNAATGPTRAGSIKGVS
jgi:hypothetical protein